MQQQDIKGLGGGDFQLLASSFALCWASSFAPARASSFALLLALAFHQRVDQIRAVQPKQQVATLAILASATRLS